MGLVRVGISKFHFQICGIFEFIQRYLGMWDNNCTHKFLFFLKKKNNQLTILFLTRIILCYPQIF